ncbi:3-hydroxy-3-methylglutaryl-CoA lyase [Nitzschia inconspicua]|uniref:hydroxymethylglutaryl-CoA lyase n=1 Tax=Nitzschia inconspicua TaxID=303405 RepID=A0A9K3PQJ6_9STRA|nr:3-hydroxy-3-methylglutaryl-CoA lyase [Nitzschia inconspicua]
MYASKTSRLVIPTICRLSRVTVRATAHLQCCGVSKGGTRRLCSVSLLNESGTEDRFMWRRTVARTFSTRQSLYPCPDIKIVEVGPRDGLQNETQLIPVEQKLHLIHRLQKAGIGNLEVGAFVSPKWVPQMADSDKIVQQLGKERQLDPSTKSKYSVLVPNQRGLESALEHHQGIDEISIFAAASESFSQRNINSTIQESMERFKDVIQHLKDFNDANDTRSPVRVRGYVSTVITCPYQGSIAPTQVAKVVELLRDLGCYEISLGDTTGVGTPGTVKNMLQEVVNVVPADQLAMHFHDTYGQALANILVGLEQFSIHTIDSSVAGLGGCPYAEGASGNVATEDVVYMLEGMGLSTGINLPTLVEAGEYICQVLNNRRNGSKVALAYKGKENCSK